MTKIFDEGDGGYMDVEGIRTWFSDQGKGPTIVLLHGAATAVDSRSTWFRTARVLEQGFRVVTFDQIGFGRTDMPAEGYLDRIARVPHALAFLRALSISNACLVGHSEGGFIATRIAILEPSLVSRLVIVTSGSTAPFLGNGRDTEWIAASQNIYDDPRQFESEDGCILVNSALNYQSDREHEAILRENFRRGVARGQIRPLSSDRGIPTTIDFAESKRFNHEYLAPYFHNLKLPTLLVWAANDPTVILERGIELLRLLPRADLHVFSGASHNVMHDRWPDFNRLLYVWNGVEIPSSCGVGHLQS